jgi:hypothetical protein
MIQDGVNVELIEEVGSVVKVRFLGIVLDNVSETFQELVFVENLSLFQNLTDYVFEFIINNDNSITIFSMLQDTSSNRRSCITKVIPVGKFKGI